MVALMDIFILIVIFFILLALLAFLVLKAVSLWHGLSIGRACKAEIRDLIKEFESIRDALRGDKNEVQ